MRSVIFAVFVNFCMLGVLLPTQAQATETIWESITACSYTWFDKQTGWRTDENGNFQSHTWTENDCTNGLPGSQDVTIGYGLNMNRISTQVDCSVTGGNIYSRVSLNGEDTGTVRCLYFDPVAASNSPELTLCSFSDSANVSDTWREQLWANTTLCSNGPPASNAVAIGQGMNGTGTSGQVDCYPSKGMHYNKSTFAGTTNAIVKCLYYNPSAHIPSTPSEMVFCTYSWTGYQSGERSHDWQTSDCTGGLPETGHVAIGQAVNGNGTVGMANCTVSGVTHFNDPTVAGQTNAIVKCLYTMPQKYIDGTDTRTKNLSDFALYACDGTSPIATALGCLFPHATPPSASPNKAISLVGDVILPPQNHTGTVSQPVLDPIAFVGDHTGDGIEEVAVAYATRETSPHVPSGEDPAYEKANIAIVDGSRYSVLAHQASPDQYVPGLGNMSHVESFAGHPLGPDARRYSYLAPANAAKRPATPGDTDADGTWDFMCQFRPELPDLRGSCALGFIQVDLSHDTTTYSANTMNKFDAPAPSSNLSTRETGAYHHDFDNDGWDDISFIYHYGNITISTGKVDQTPPNYYSAANYNVYCEAENYSASQCNSTNLGFTEAFHAGRNYGSHTVFEDPATQATRTLVVAGTPVGIFDKFCNVSRFVSLEETPANGISSESVLWAKYLSFYSTAYSSQPASNTNISRAGDFLDDCLHRISDSRSVMDGQNIVIYNYFKQLANSFVEFTVTADSPTGGPAPNENDNVDGIDDQYGCEWELQNYQNALYYENNDTYTVAQRKEATNIWLDCAVRMAAIVKGTWNTQMLYEADGAVATGSTGTYVWGYSDDILPSGETVYFVETVPTGSFHDLTKITTPVVKLKTLVNGLYQDLGTLPGNARPVLKPINSNDQTSYGKYGPIKVLDIDICEHHEGPNESYRFRFGSGSYLKASNGTVTTSSCPI